MIIKVKIPPHVLILAGLLTIMTGCRKEDKPLDPVVDIDGNAYKTVNINNRIWMTENLRTTRYNDGGDIPLTADAEKWNNLMSDGFCWYNNDASNKDTYRAIYNDYAIVTGNLCPAGWHVPSIEEWRELSTVLGDSATESAGDDLWSAGLYYAESGLTLNHKSKKYRFSVRCLKD